jgi:hypothetical protein
LSVKTSWCSVVPERNLEALFPSLLFYLSLILCGNEQKDTSLFTIIASKGGGDRILWLRVLAVPAKNWVGIPDKEERSDG